VMHGGVVATVMDSAAAVALGRLRGEKMRRDKPHATVDMNVALISAARPGDELIVEGRVLKLRRSVAFCEAEARRLSDNELIAKGRFTFAISSRDG
jgi:acyl-coenzyme A thioesterase PaaI-like protein